MTGVIPTLGRPVHHGLMDPQAERKLVAQAATEHDRVRRSARAITADDFPAVLSLGSAVVLHGLLEERHLYSVNRFLDPAFRDELVAEHREIGEHLTLLERLMTTEPDSSDLPALSEAVLARLRRHLERDERVLYRPLNRPGLGP